MPQQVTTAEPLSQRIRQAMADHAQAFPDGDWRAVNDRLTSLFEESAPILLAAGINPWAGGNEGSARALEAMGL